MMVDPDKYYVFSTIGRCGKDDIRFDLVRRIKEKDLGIIKVTSTRRWKWLRFFRKKQVKWIDITYLGGYVHPEEADFNDGFTTDINRYIFVLKALLSLSDLHYSDNILTLLDGLNDDERDRYVI